MGGRRLVVVVAKADSAIVAVVFPFEEAGAGERLLRLSLREVAAAVVRDAANADCGAVNQINPYRVL